MTVRMVDGLPIDDEPASMYNGVPNDELICYVRRLEYDFQTGIGYLHLPPLNCTCMSGAIAMFERIDPAVRLIATVADGTYATVYLRKGKKWTSRMLRYENMRYDEVRFKP